MDMGANGGGFGRREFLTRAGAGALGAALGAGGLRAQEGPKAKKAGDSAEKLGPYAPFRMAVQSYSLRNLGFEKMVEALFSMEIRFVELYPGHFPMDLGEQETRARRRLMRHNSVSPISYGVVSFGKDQDKNRAVFEFAKAMNLLSISADPSLDSLDGLEKLVEEYKIPVAIHNHGPEDQRWRTPEMIEKGIGSRNKLIGLCVDTGHFLRVDVDPVEVVKKFPGRIHGVHLKDVKSEGAKKRFTVLGEGDLKTEALLKVLREQNFQGNLSLEYEEEPDDPVPSIKKCLATVRAAVAKKN